MTPVVVSVSIPAAAFISQISSAEEVSDAADPAVPELLPLQCYVGRWETEITGKTLIKRIEVGEWILKGSFLRQCWSTTGPEDAPKASGITIMTFDSVKKSYLSWSFLAIRSVVHKEGFWDAASQTMTWTDQLAATGETVVTKSCFVDSATNVWSITETDANGKVVRSVDGKSIRCGS